MQLCWCNHVTFLAAKKVTKEGGIGEALSAGQLPRQSRPPLCTPPGRTYDTSEHLNLHPEHSKNVPIFAVQGFCFWNSAGRRERSRRHQQDHDDVPSRRENVMQFFGACGWGTQGRTQFVARQRGMSASPVPTSLVTFLCGNKKVTSPDEFDKLKFESLQAM